MCFSVFAHGCARRVLASTTLLVVTAAPQLSAQDNAGNAAAQPVPPSDSRPEPVITRRAGGPGRSMSVRSLRCAGIRVRLDVIRRQIGEGPFAP